MSTEIVILDLQAPELVEVAGEVLELVIQDLAPAEVVAEVVEGPPGPPGMSPPPTVYTTSPVHILAGDYFSIVALSPPGDALIVMPGADAQAHEYVIKWRDPAHQATLTDPTGRTFDGAATALIDGSLGWKGLVKSDTLNDWSIVR